jgi:hypothetical protein
MIFGDNLDSVAGDHLDCESGDCLDNEVDILDLWMEMVYVVKDTQYWSLRKPPPHCDYGCWDVYGKAYLVYH